MPRTSLACTGWLVRRSSRSQRTIAAILCPALWPAASGASSISIVMPCSLEPPMGTRTSSPSPRPRLWSTDGDRPAVDRQDQAERHPPVDGSAHRQGLELAQVAVACFGVGQAMQAAGAFGVPQLREEPHLLQAAVLCRDGGALGARPLRFIPEARRREILEQAFVRVDRDERHLVQPGDGAEVQDRPLERATAGFHADGGRLAQRVGDLGEGHVLQRVRRGAVRGFQRADAQADGLPARPFDDEGGLVAARRAGLFEENVHDQHGRPAGVNVQFERDGAWGQGRQFASPGLGRARVPDRSGGQSGIRASW